MRRNTTDPEAGEPLGGPVMYRVELQADLTATGHVDGLVTVPKTPADPDDPGNTDADWWRTTTEKIRNIRNGVPNAGTIPSGNVAWIHNYFGRWVVIVPEC